MGVKYREDRGYWYIDTSWPDGIRTRLTVPDESSGKRINKKIEGAIVDEVKVWKKLRKELGLEGGTLQGFSEFADLYYENYVLIHNRSPKSKKSRLGILKRHFKHTPIDALNISSLDDFVSARRREKAGNKTINRDISTLRHMLTWAAKRGYIEINPIAGYERLKEIEWVGERPDEAIIDQIFNKLSPVVVPVFTFIRETGCRKGEAISLKWSQIDLSRTQVVFHSNTKNGRSRQVPLTQAALWAVSEMPKIRETVFYHPETLKKWTGDSLAIPWERARHAAGSGLRIHDLRHAYGIKLAEDGCPMHFISEVLGHHSIDFTRKHYAKFSPESAGRAVLRVLEGRKAISAAS